MRALVVFALALLVGSLYGQSKPVTISIEDRLSVTLVGYKEYSGLYDVASDGTISGPGFGVAKVAGKTLAQATELLKSKFKLVLQDPTVYVGLAVERAKVVYVVGIPISPNPTVPIKAGDIGRLPQGAIVLQPDTTVRTILAGASFGDRPDNFEALVIRKGETVHRIDIDRLLKGATDVFDGPFEPSDVLVIRPKGRVKVWFVGPFRQPGDHLVAEGLTIDQAISSFGGYDPSLLPQGQDLGVQVLGRAHLVLSRGGKARTLRAIAGNPDLSLPVEAGDTLTLVLPTTVNITVAGFVIRPSEVSVDSGISALGAIAKAGGPDPRGGLSNVLLYRGNEVHHLNLSPGAALPSQMPLQANDLLYVSENRRMIQVLGQAKLPGVIYLPDDGREFRASEALARAGGLTPEGSLRRAVVVRRDATGKFKVQQQFNLDEFLKDGKTASNPVLQPGDVLYFGTPKGISSTMALQLASQVINSAAVLYSFGIRF